MPSKLGLSNLGNKLILSVQQGSFIYILMEKNVGTQLYKKKSFLG